MIGRVCTAEWRVRRDFDVLFYVPFDPAVLLEVWM